MALAIAAFLGCARGDRGRPVVVALESVPRTLDPHHHNEVVTWSVLCNFYDALVHFSPRIQLEPALALSWVQLDATHLRFSLRPGVRFHNGDRFTSADVVASFQRALKDPRSMIRHHLVGIRDLRAEGELSVLVETTAPAPTLLNRLAFLFIVPERNARLGEISEPIGTGPYRFLGREADGSVVAEGWRGWWGAPEVGRVVFSFVEDDQARLGKLLRGEADIATRLPYDAVAEGLSQAGVRVEPQPRMAVQIVVVVAQAAPEPARRALGDARVRRAILLALDRARYVSHVYRGNATVASQYVHPVVFGYDPAIQALAYDPGEARRLLVEAGFGGGFEVELAHGGQNRGVVAEIVADLKKVGIRVKPVPLGLGELIAAGHAHRYALLYYARTCTTADASEFLDSSMHTEDAARGLGGENFALYSCREVDSLLDAAEGELATQSRGLLLQRAQRRVLEDLPILPLTVWWDDLGVSSRLDVVTRHDAWLWIAGFHWRH